MTLDPVSIILIEISEIYPLRKAPSNFIVSVINLKKANTTTQIHRKSGEEGRRVCSAPPQWRGVPGSAHRPWKLNWVMDAPWCNLWKRPIFKQIIETNDKVNLFQKVRSIDWKIWQNGCINKWGRYIEGMIAFRHNKYKKIRYTPIPWI